MAAHVYWRANIAGTDGGTTLTLAEIELHTAIAGANVATGGTATASSGTAANAFDASNATNWAVSADTAGWIQYQLLTALDIVEFSITAPSATMTNAPNRCSLQYSDDNVNFFTIALVNGQTSWTTNEKRTFTTSTYPTNIGVGTMLANMIPAITSTVPAFSTVNTLNPAAYRTYTGPRKYLSGTVKENGTNVARMVRAYHRVTGQFLGEATSNATTGAFSIESMGWSDNCYVVAFDSLAIAPDYNAIIYDLVIPV